MRPVGQAAGDGVGMAGVLADVAWTAGATSGGATVAAGLAGARAAWSSGGCGLLAKELVVA